MSDGTDPRPWIPCVNLGRINLVGPGLVQYLADCTSRDSVVLCLRAVPVRTVTEGTHVHSHDTSFYTLFQTDTHMTYRMVLHISIIHAA